MKKSPDFFQPSLQANFLGCPAHEEGLGHCRGLWGLVLISGHSWCPSHLTLMQDLLTLKMEVSLQKILSATAFFFFFLTQQFPHQCSQGQKAHLFGRLMSNTSGVWPQVEMEKREKKREGQEQCQGEGRTVQVKYLRCRGLGGGSRGAGWRGATYNSVAMSAPLEYSPWTRNVHYILRSEETTCWHIVSCFKFRFTPLKLPATGSANACVCEGIKPLS